MIKTITILAVGAALVALSACSSNRAATATTSTRTSAVYSK